MINRNKLSGTFYAVIISLLLITISKINSLQNTIDNFKITIDEIAYTPVKEKMMYRSDGTYSPITIKEDNPENPYEDYVASEQGFTKNWREKGYNPEGPVGLEGQTPPVYSDMSNIIEKKRHKVE